MKEPFQILNWDTEFFRFKVAKIANDLSLDIDYATKELNKGSIKLAYLFSNKPLEDSVLNNEFYNIFLVHKRIPLVKTLTKVTKIHEKISLYKKTFPEDELISLAQLAGSHSRFGADPNIPRDKFNELFKLWMINSVKKKIASEVLVYREEGKIIGFGTIKVENGVAQTPLFAVERKHEGKGVSFALMRAIETILLERGCKKVLGGTQEMNKKALAVYERYGLELQDPEYVYHFWKR